MRKILLAVFAVVAVAAVVGAARAKTEENGPIVEYLTALKGAK